MQQHSENKTERFVFMVEKSTLEAIDDWGFSRRIRTRAEAIRQLVQIGIETTNSEMKKADARS
ncbi:hypothetical protein EYC79_03800 [Agrobacterium cavarae]|uniref:Uncharacterized protein n=1 Tax=Agrobacterium cavarae TaxID=2528239 RepID=A0ABY1YEN7_9HYPH|nr:hypothetical protein [Agrobacterium cavarae]TBN16945.1 hypothetical protein EYC79_03800 [Agrobacterium cavarae]